MEKFKKYLLLPIFVFITLSISAQNESSKNTPDSSIQTEKSIEQTADSVEPLDLIDSFNKILNSTGFVFIDFKVILMLLISCLLIYLAIAKQYEPLLLLPIAFGMLLSNFPTAGMFNPELFANGKIHW
ncbi:MAG TPA: sodium ion-translocating decarboxylase subunit beta, partial [Bacteroidales bacterium]|nr:sodium ion-translocating decarboxylase subunit beta [Bacteroidales bacterium]